MTENQIADLLNPYLLPGSTIPHAMYGRLFCYLELLLKWNAKTNLTAIREPEEIVRRHFGESLFAAQYVGSCKTLLDFGSGAGFPGVPIQLFRPEIQVTLAESQNKKSTFLREVARTLNLKTEIWADRVESMPENRNFDVVALRAVDNMSAALAAAAVRAETRILLLTTSGLAIPSDWQIESEFAVPDTTHQKLLVLRQNPHS